MPDRLLEEHSDDPADVNYTLLWRLDPYDHDTHQMGDHGRRPAFLRRRESSGWFGERETLEDLDEQIMNNMYLDGAERKMPAFHADRLAEIRTCKQWEAYNTDAELFKGF